MWKELRQCLLQAQARIENNYDGANGEMQFQVADFVLLEVQPNKETTLALRMDQKLSQALWSLSNRSKDQQYGLSTSLNPLSHMRSNALLKWRSGVTEPSSCKQGQAEPLKHMYTCKTKRKL